MSEKKTRIPETPRFLNIDDPEKRAAMIVFYESLPLYEPGMKVRCPTKNWDGTEAESCRGCGSENVDWNGDCYDCYDCGIFFSDYAADPPHRRADDDDNDDEEEEENDGD